MSSSAMSSPALELLDEYWFFSNTLASSNKPPREDSKKGSCSPGPCHCQGGGQRRLLRTPSPSPAAERRQEAAGNREQRQAAACRQQEEHDEVEEDDLNWSSIYEGVLRTRMAEATTSSSSRPALRRAASSSATGQAPKLASTTRRRPSHQPVLPRSKSGLFIRAEDKWRSSGDLESIQGFRDLGKTGRPPALVRVQSEARSSAEVKDQLRMWAQAVACNVRQEC